MKKKSIRTLIVILIATMLLPTIATFTVTAQAANNCNDVEDELGELLNCFPREENYEYDPYIRQHNNNIFVSSPYIPVTAEDTLYIAALNHYDYLKRNEHHVVSLFSQSYIRLSTVMLTSLELVEDIGYGYGIYKYTVPEQMHGLTVAYATVDVHQGIYNDGDVLVTKNQSFTGEQFREAVGIAEASEEVKAHPFYDKKALFIGDSISYGSFDTPPTYRNPSASWARRLTLATGLIPTNISYPGASVGKNDAVKWEYELFETELLSENSYDMIVFHGGVNDARRGVEAGIALSADTEREDLIKDERIATFAGGLQLMFHDARERWPEAELYYIANFKLASDQVGGKDMNEYFDQAKLLCAAYDVHYIDLFDDESLYDVFDYTSTEILPDLIHPSGPSYDILFPTVLRLFNATLSADDDNGGDNVITPGEQTPPNTPGDNGDGGNNANGSHETNPGLSLPAIIAIAAGTVIVALGSFALYWLVFKKR